MSSVAVPQAVVPGRSIGSITLGVSLHDVLSRLKAHPHIYTSIDVSYSSAEPIALPIVVSLPQNGLRLRFDGPDQRLRLIEVINFTRTTLAYRDDEIFKLIEQSSDVMSPAVANSGPVFRHVYKLFGPSQPGEYIPPAEPQLESHGTYVLSYPGIAFSFPFLHSAWKPAADSAKATGLLMSSASSPALSMAIFSGHSWPDARRTLFTSEPPHPRSLALSQKGKELRPAEIELARVHGEGRIELVRKHQDPFWITLSRTTPQDLITELGPPDAIYKKVDRRSDIHKQQSRNVRSHSASPAHGEDSSETDYASSYADDSDVDDSGVNKADRDELEAAEVFYNYFSHGFDILLSQPTTPSPPVPPLSMQRPKGAGTEPLNTSVLARNLLTATKLILHGNIPGSYTFNRHRRSRWILQHVPTNAEGPDLLNSEMKFGDMHKKLETAFKHAYASEEERRIQQEPMSVHREVGDSPSSSCELVAGPMEGMSITGDERGGAESGSGDGDERERIAGNTQIWPFPGMLFEVLRNGAISALTVF